MRPPSHQTAVVTLLGRPNVGKSTLFNRMCRARAALVADYAGLTRDRHYGTALLAGTSVTLIDTGGLADPDVHPDNEAVFEAVDAQVESALDETDVVSSSSMPAMAWPPRTRTSQGGCVGGALPWWSR